MTVTVTADITVDTGDLRNALDAVLPHAEPNKTGDLDAQHRVRFIADKHHIYVTASNGATAACAIVSIEEDSRTEKFAPEDGPLRWDLTPRQGRLILQQFKAKATDPEGIEQIVCFHISVGQHIELEDAGGLFAGETVSFPYVEPTSGVDVVAVVGRALASAGASPVGKQLVSDGQTLKLFRAASAAYGQPLVISSSGTDESRAFTVECGESFLGVISSRHHDDDSLARRQAWRLSWLERLGKSARTLVSA
jgi:hypothetical protein